MGLLATPQISWKEPVFFVLKMRDRRGWLLRLLLAGGIAAVMFVAMLFDKRPFPVWQSLPASLGIGLFLAAVPDFPNYQRDVTIFDDRLSCMGVGGLNLSMITCALADIHLAQLRRPEETGRTCGTLAVNLRERQFLFGVPANVDVEKIAAVLHRLEVPVELEGWTPSETDDRTDVKEEIALSTPVAGSATAEIHPVPEQAGPLISAGAKTLAFAIALGPLLAGVAAAIAIAIVIYLQWDALNWQEATLWIAGAVAAFIAGFLFLIVVGEPLANRYLIPVARESLPIRGDLPAHTKNAELLPVEVFDRRSWTAMAARADDFGFLIADLQDRCLLFEGNQRRWRVPVAALRACRIEEATVGAHGDAASEKRYYVVIAAETDGEPWEAGLVPSRTQFGWPTSARRHAAARTLLERIEPLARPQAGAS